ncbi:hypothetical protein ZHAS_00019853 [Anopheles sinensis]|uniref:Uncharacterized protein n=1 Tax=Anopheles sinensis TaxID=74873 RepID=A0A084WNG5_ANOSI|nr:hypothetical protein ZHAS_00019853 [Anopheles sinensis]
MSNISQQQAGVGGGSGGGGILGSHKVDHRGSSLPPSALPRPPRSLKPPRKIEYGRLSDGGESVGMGKKTRAVTPPSPASSSGSAGQKDAYGGSLKRSVVGGREFSPAKGGNYVEMKDTMQLTKDYGGGGGTLKHKTYGSMTTVGVGSGATQHGGSKFGFGTSSKSSSPSVGGTAGSSGDYPSTKNYQRLEETSPGHRHNNSSPQSSQSRKSSADSGTLKRSLLPNVGRKLPSSGMNVAKGGGGSRDSLNSASSGSNNSNPGPPGGAGAALSRSSPQPPAPNSAYHHQPHNINRTPPRFLHQHQPSGSVESNKSHPTTYASMPPTAQQIHHGFFAKFPASQSASPARTVPQHQPKNSSSLPSSSILHAAATSSATSAIGQSSTASLPPKPSMLDKSSTLLLGGNQQRRGSSLARNENKYRIQF